ncbi:hypothetical protein BaRGS_00016380, partial [Batillaria attramentaria]
ILFPYRNCGDSKQVGRICVGSADGDTPVCLHRRREQFSGPRVHIGDERTSYFAELHVKAGDRAMIDSPSYRAGRWFPPALAMSEWTCIAQQFNFPQKDSQLRDFPRLIQSWPKRISGQRPGASLGFACFLSTNPARVVRRIGIRTRCAIYRPAT